MSSLNPDEAQHYVRQVAQHRGWVVNEDKGLVDPIVQGLALQSSRWGRPFCPCRDVENPERDRDIICPCVYAQPDIDEFGQCYCGLFLAPEKDPAEVTSIPERRPPL